MKPHPRIRKTIKWGGAVVTVLLALGTFTSDRWCAGWHERGYLYAAFTGGAARISTAGWPGGGVMEHTGVLPYPQVVGFTWAPYGLRSGKEWYAILPSWPLPAVTFIASCFAWRNDWRLSRRERAARLNLCPKCDYDRAGIGVGVVCPECGSKGGTA